MTEQLNKTTYLDPTIETGHAEPVIVAFFEDFFAAKNSGSPERFAAQFSTGLLAYTDAALGWENTSHDALRQGLEQFMPSWGDGRAYATRIIGGPVSAVVAFTDTPELFGDEIHGLGAVDVRDGKVVRWIDYWDSATFDRSVFGMLVAPDHAYPSDFRSESVEDGATGAIRDVVASLHAALGDGDGAAAAAAALFAFSARWEDLALRTLVTGRTAIARYVDRMINAPYGAGSAMRHVLGGPLGGGYEWIASPSTNVRAGITALEFDERGLIVRLTTIYDADRLDKDQRRALILGSQDF